MMEPEDQPCDEPSQDLIELAAEQPARIFVAQLDYERAQSRRNGEKPRES
ncbi:MAG: hypothetical protein M1358_13960 [Chloroflexi bacterium]|nr:hypothetical protein [Chloroflexota bacterium]